MIVWHCAMWRLPMRIIVVVSRGCGEELRRVVGRGWVLYTRPSLQSVSKIILVGVWLIYLFRSFRNVTNSLGHNKRKTRAATTTSRKQTTLPNTPYSKARPKNRARVPKRWSQSHLTPPSNNNNKKEASLPSLLLQSLARPLLLLLQTLLHHLHHLSMLWVCYMLYFHNFSQVFISFLTHARAIDNGIGASNLKGCSPFLLGCYCCCYDKRTNYH